MTDPVTAIGGAVSVGGALMQSSAAGDAADAQSGAAANSTAEQRRQYDQTRQDQKPFYNTGVSANQQLAYLMGLNPTASSPAPLQTSTSLSTAAQQPAGGQPLSKPEWEALNARNGMDVGGTKGEYEAYLTEASKQFNGYYGTPAPVPAATPATATGTYDNTNPNLGGFGSLAKGFSMADYEADPGYAFRLSEGQKALERSAAAKGGLNSGAAMKAAITYGQGQGSQEYGNAYNRYNTNQTNLYNRLAGLAGSGQTSANTLATVGQNTANQISGNYNAVGNAQAAGSIAQGNAWSTGLNNVASSLYNNSNGNQFGAVGTAVHNSITNPLNGGFF